MRTTYIDVPAWAARLAVKWFQKIAAGEITGALCICIVKVRQTVTTEWAAWHPRPLINFLAVAETTAELRECLARFNPSQITDAGNRVKYVDAIAKMVRLHVLHRRACL